MAKAKNASNPMADYLTSQGKNPLSPLPAPQPKQTYNQLVNTLGSQGFQPITDWSKVPAGSVTRSESYVTGFQGKNGWIGDNQTAQFYKPGEAPQPAPAAAPEAPSNPPGPTSTNLDQAGAVAAYGNPALTIPGVDVRLTGENVGIKAKRSKSSSSGGGSGTSRLIIPRSAGTNSLNI